MAIILSDPNSELGKLGKLRYSYQYVADNAGDDQCGLARATMKQIEDRRWSWQYVKKRYWPNWDDVLYAR